MTIPLFEAKRAARALRADVPDLSHSKALEIVAHQLGHRDWNTASAKLAGDIGTAVPILRIFDEAMAREFYVDYLGCTVEWEHRFEPGMPLYTRIRRDQLVIDLSEHHGDGTPGSAVWVPVTDVHALHGELSAKNHPRQRPGVDEHAPGGPTLTIIDPFANVIRFCQVVDR
ncbi:MAG: glyoxalase superfamily protein [Actinophytocola sp.]|uniref:glyoxalase superfamily protein n=1 Tax=Actinophytocola sp. TaxID=1872138 RepID=UPI003C72073D